MPHINAHLVMLRTRNMASSFSACGKMKGHASGAQTERRGWLRPVSDLLGGETPPAVSRLCECAVS
jgi:hypothetical protein